LTGKDEFHNGIDIAAVIGSNVLAADDGEIIEADENSLNGVFLRYKTMGGLVVTYAHLSETLAEEGDSVKRGQTVARSGNTGRSDGPHLHVSISLDGEFVDPSSYIDF
jgi:murein DD-endopeptidase MepM/ murein hydrolase activator NlpD